MKLIKKYSNLQETCKYINIQIKDSLTFAEKYIKQNCIETPKEFFNILRNNTTYTKDGELYGKKRELLQTFQTLMLNNIHGYSGYGDCDCFTIAICSGLFFITNVQKVGYCLAGRNQKQAVHVWSVCKYMNSYCNLDLTESKFNQVRFYPYKQIIWLY